MNSTINTVSKINNQALNPQEFIKFCEDNYHNEIKELADTIFKNRDIKVVMIAGPSGSGKTTTAAILKEYLKNVGISATTVSLDDFYLPFDELPILENGEADTESVDSLDIPLIQKCLSSVILTGEAKWPKFDFKKKIRIDNANYVDIRSGGIIIVEGLHALNPVIIKMLDSKNIYKVYISVSDSVYNDAGEEVLSSKKVRFIRRTLRDEKFRNSDINVTLGMWPQVLNGEEHYLYPFKPYADKIIVTLHPYELCVYKNHFEQMVHSADKNHPVYEYATIVLNGLQGFSSISPDLVPLNSLIREFIGDGIFND